MTEGSRTQPTWSAADFDYPLPEALIAQTPTAERGASRMLVVDRTAGGATHASPQQASPLRDGWFTEITDLIPSDDLVVVNSTRVRHARLHGTRPTGGPAEVLLIHPAPDDTWIAMGSPGSAMKPGKRIALSASAAIETLTVNPDGTRRVRFVGMPATEAIARFGQLPLPPYIVRAPTADDELRYQTVYADREGSVAAPTAGLHFTNDLLDALQARGVTVATLDLEVGPGTFRPVEGEDITAHRMHAERFEIPPETAAAIAACRSRAGQVWAVGTTVVRALESAANDDGTVREGSSETTLLVAPGFHFRVVDHLLTNFHLPRSTLLMLVAGFAGHHLMMTAYRHAVAAGYRFYSYGDAMLIL